MQSHTPRHSSKKDSEKTDLHLNGSQINLSSRPKTGSGKASVRSMSVSSVRSRRPMSAMPALEHQAKYMVMSKLGEWRRPQSADNPYYAGGDCSFSSSLPTSESDLHDETRDQPSMRRRNKLAAKFPLLETDLVQDMIGKGRTREVLEDQEPNHDFGATYTLSSSDLLNCLGTEPYSCTWSEAELQQLHNEITGGNNNNSCESENDSESPGSEDPCHSESSLGARIIEMAQCQQVNSLPLQPGLTAKPPLPCRKNLVQGAAENNQTDLALKTHSLQHDMKAVSDNSTNGATEEPEIASMAFPLSKQLSESAVEHEDEHSYGIKSRMKNSTFNDNISQLSLQERVIAPLYKDSVYTEQDKSLPFMHLDRANSTDCYTFQLLSSDIAGRASREDAHSYTDIKFHNWFPSTVPKDESVSAFVPSSRILNIEKQTDLLLKHLAMEQGSCGTSDGSQPTNIRDVKVSVSDDGQHRGKLNRVECLGQGDVSLTKYPDHLVETITNCKSNDKELPLPLQQEEESSKNKTPPQCFDLCEDLDQSKANFEKEEILGGEECEAISVLDSNKKTRAIDDGNLVFNMSGINKGSQDPDNFACITYDHGHEETKSSTIMWSPIRQELPEKDKNDPSVQPSLSSPSRTAAIIPVVNSTYDEIVNILQVLEQEEAYSILKLEGLGGLKLISESAAISSIRDEQFNQDILPTSSKLRDILTYLDEVDHSCNFALDSAKSRLQAVRDTTKYSELKLEDMPRLEELLNMSTVDLAHEVLTLKLQLEEKGNAVALLQETLNQQRELTLRNTRNADRDAKTRLKEQKKEYESIISRHQNFIDQLIADKKKISENCEALVRELKISEERLASNLKASEERHGIELQRAREMHAAAEKLRRERWIDNKTQKIKELTVKGLEPELQRMSTRHQQELSDLRTLHKQELEELELRAARRTSQQMEQLRDQLVMEKEEALTRERELLRQRVEKQAEKEEAAYQEQRRKLLTEIRREKDRLAEEEARMKQELEEAKKNLVRDNVKDLERAKRDYEESLETFSRRHQNELKSLKEKSEIEKEAWIHNYKKQQAALIVEREGEIREQYKRERDREIELVIERLENEATQSRFEQEQAAENRLRRLKETFDREIMDLETSQEALKTKYNESKSNLVGREDEVINLRASLRQTEKELQEARKITDRLSSERAEVKGIVRQEVQSQLSNMEEENIRLREEMAERRMKHQMELASKGEEVVKCRAEKEKELLQVYNRVKLAVAKKDKAIEQMSLQHGSALERCHHLEELLEQQRRDFLLK